MADIPADYRPLKASERTVRAGARRTGSANPSEILTVSVRVRRRSDAPLLPDLSFVSATPGRLTPHLSREEFAARFGASEDDLAKIATFGAENGLSVVESSISRRTIVLRGTVAQMRKAFAVDLGTYETLHEKYRGREGPLYLPTAIVEIVEGVFGLDNRKMAESQISRSENAADVGSANGTMFMTPPQVAQLYNFPTWPATGQTIGIIEFEAGYLDWDLNLFFDSLGLPVPSINYVGILGEQNIVSSLNLENVEEAVLDICVAGSAAPGARLVIYNAPNSEQGWVDSVTSAIHDAAQMPSVISISWGTTETEAPTQLKWTLSAIQAVNATFQEAALLGVTVVVASGDHGSEGRLQDGKAHVEYPGSDPYVTAVGGTTISNVSGTIFTEFTWNTAQGATGGGISDIFSMPPWQGFARVPGSINDGHNGRGVPDVAGNGDGNSGYIIYIDGTPSTKGVGGTSAAAPLYAALVASLNAGLGESVGYLNPTLYLAAGYVFRDIADGQTNAFLGAPGYLSGLGWDACTGLGVVNGIALKYALQGGPDAMSLLTAKSV